MKVEFGFAAWAGLLFVAIGCGTPREITFQPDGQSDNAFSMEPYGRVLSTIVDGRARVNYKGLKAKREDLDAFGAALAGLSPSVYEGWSKEQKIAFWINAYNALTLVAVVEHYPIESGNIVASLRFPKNSIRQISGVWDELSFQVLGRKVTLDHIEHKILRKEFNEPRIHMALVCAATGCPPLRREPYRGADLMRQLDDQTRRFLAIPSKFRIDRAVGKVFLSSIFKWFGKDFLERYGTDERFADHDEVERALLNFLLPYLSVADRSYLTSQTYEIAYMDYDWSLNEQSS